MTAPPDGREHRPPAIRPARVEEAELLSGLALRSKAVWGYGPEFMRRCEPLLRVSESYIGEHPVVVAEEGGRVLGFYALNHARYEIELDLLFVEPGSLRRGVGRALLDHALDAARTLGHRELYVESDPGAEAFYLRMGGTRIGTVTSTVEAGRRLPLLRFGLS